MYSTLDISYTVNNTLSEVLHRYMQAVAVVNGTLAGELTAPIAVSVNSLRSF
jgi:hypothetical protein